jgi:hypothetical protein
MVIVVAPPNGLGKTQISITNKSLLPIEKKCERKLSADKKSIRLTI